MVALECFKNLQIIVDYTESTWKASATKRFATALRYPDRVCGIAVRRPEKGSDNLKISKALDLPFPALESLVVDNTRAGPSIILPTSLTTSIQSLRHLQLINTRLTSLFPLLPVTGTLVDLNLNIDTIYYTTNGGSLLAHLQHMPHLCNLQVTTQLYCWRPTVEKPPPTTVLLAELTSIRLSGPNSQTEWFLAGLVTPSLRELHISAFDRDYRSSRGFDIPCLSKFIRVAGMCFFAARLALSPSSLMSRIALFAPSHSVDAPSQVVTINTPLSAEMGSAFSAMLAILEDIFLSFSANRTPYGSLLGDLAPWRKFFGHFCNVKVLRLHHGLEMEVAFMLWQPSVNPPPPQEDIDPDTMTTPINSSRSQYIFPSLEQIVVYPRTPDASIGTEERASALEPFGLFKAARHQMGRPVKVSWNTDGEIPVCSLTEPAGYMMHPIMHPMTETAGHMVHPMDLLI